MPTRSVNELSAAPPNSAVRTGLLKEPPDFEVVVLDFHEAHGGGEGVEEGWGRSG
jgi:hypothetical protein